MADISAEQLQADTGFTSSGIPVDAVLVDTVAEQVVTVQPTTVRGSQSSSIGFLSARGAFYRVELSNQTGPGLYSIEELDRVTGDGTGTATSNGKAPILITGIEISHSDIVSQIPCLNNVKVFYAFGQNFGTVAIQGEVLLGPLGDITTEGVERLMDFFWKHRVSKSNLPIKISVAKRSYFVYLVGLKIGTIDPNFHILPFGFFGTLLDLSKEDLSKVNPGSIFLDQGSLDNPALVKALSVRNPKTNLQAVNDTSRLDANAGQNDITKDFEPTPAGVPANAGAVVTSYKLAGNLTKSEQVKYDGLRAARIQARDSGDPAVLAQFDSVEGEELERLKNKLNPARPALIEKRKADIQNLVAETEDGSNTTGSFLTQQQRAALSEKNRREFVEARMGSQTTILSR